MNKQTFMSILRTQLKSMPEEDKKDILYDYEEHFAVGLSEGRDEEEIASSLGNPKQLAKQIKANYMITKVENEFTIGNFFQALFATIGLGFFNLVVVFGPFVAIAATLLSFVVVGIALVGSGLAVIIAMFFPQFLQNAPHPLIGIFTGLGLISFGALWTIGSLYLSKWFYLLAIKYLKLNLNIITNRRMKND